MHAQSHAALESNINVTPLVDVCLVLLIIFMVVVPVMVNGVPVKLPVAKGEPVSEAERQLAITVKDDGTVYLGAVAVRTEQVASELQRMHGEEPDRSVAVRGDQSVAYREVLRVLDACRSAGYNDVRLMSEPPQAANAN
ncbi:MAG: biopolymer transport protein TolR [Thermoanaerobaculia bacterium]|jgi:biopolymer transport protein ExbD|nr:biopolymer transport protein TolR [Thermoanaerobaculia bacterium]